MTTEVQAAAPAAEAAPAAPDFKTRSVPSDLPKTEVPSAQPETPAEPVPDEVKPPEPEAGSNDPDDDEAGEQPPEKQPLPKGVQRKINKLTRRVGEKDAQLAELQERLAQYEQGQVQQKPADAPTVAKQAEGRPKLEDFDFDQDAHAEALVEWKLKQREQQEAIETRKRKFSEQEAAFAAEHPDYEDVAKNPEVPITRDMVMAMVETDNPPAIAYYLGQNPDEAAEIAQMGPLAAARAIGRIEAKLAAPPPKPAAPRELPKKTTNAPPPPKTVTGAGRPEVTVDDPQISTAQRIALWKSGKR